MCVHACVHVCVCACVWVCVRAMDKLPDIIAFISISPHHLCDLTETKP